jgi:predicted nucleic acid-binding Zn ribbon protein
MKNCLECTEKIVGREDKKFCSDGCRNAYNKINKDSNNNMRNTNNKLRKIIVFYQNLILKENQNNPSQINKQGF